MRECEVDNKRTLASEGPDYKRIKELYTWFRTEYRDRLDVINRHMYLGLPLEETKWTLENEAYEKEQELRKLLGKEALPEIRVKKII